MARAAEMIDTTPAPTGYERDALVRGIEACYECAQVCTACADACLGEDSVAELRRCITLDLNCADICGAAGRALSRQTEYDSDVSGALLRACRDVCRRCADECEQHAAMHANCRVCAEACRACADACDALLTA